MKKSKKSLRKTSRKQRKTYRKRKLLKKRMRGGTNDTTRIKQDVAEPFLDKKEQLHAEINAKYNKVREQRGIIAEQQIIIDNENSTPNQKQEARDKVAAAEKIKEELNALNEQMAALEKEITEAQTVALATAALK